MTINDEWTTNRRTGLFDPGAVELTQTLLVWAEDGKDEVDLLIIRKRP